MRFPAQAPSRAQYGPRGSRPGGVSGGAATGALRWGRELLSDLLGASTSLGDVVEWVNQAATILEPVEAQIKPALSRAPGAA